MTITELRREWKLMYAHFEIRSLRAFLPSALFFAGYDLIVATRQTSRIEEFAWVLVKNGGQEVVYQFDHSPSLTELMEVSRDVAQTTATSGNS